MNMYNYNSLWLVAMPSLVVTHLYGKKWLVDSVYWECIEGRGQSAHSNSAFFLGTRHFRLPTAATRIEFTITYLCRRNRTQNKNRKEKEQNRLHLESDCNVICLCYKHLN